MNPSRITARDLMRTDFVELATDRPLREAMDLLLRLQEQDSRPRIIIVVDGEGRYEGLLTSKLIFRSLLALWRPSRSVRDDPARLEEEVLGVAADRAEMRVHDALVRGLSTAAPDDRWFRLIEKVCEPELEFLPVVDDGKVIGIVAVTELFYTTANLALTPGDLGIRTEG